MQDNQKSNAAHQLEGWLAILGALGCLILTAIIWQQVRAYQGIWPLPGLYFIELASVSVISTAVFIHHAPTGVIFTWCAAGIFAAFFYAAGFSVGLFYLPVALIYAGISISYDVRNRGPIAMHLLVAIIAGAAQFALMLILIRLLNPDAIF